MTGNPNPYAQPDPNAGRTTLKGRTYLPGYLEKQALDTAYLHAGSDDDSAYMLNSAKGAPNGVAPLDGNGLLPAANVPANLTPTALNATYAKIVNGELKSKLATDGSDQTATVNAELAALYAAGGGTWTLPAGTIRVDSQITIPNDGGTSFRQPPIFIKGQGARQDGQWGGANTALGGTVLDLRYQGSGAKIVTLGRGLLAAENVTFADNGTGNTTPFILTTNTTLKIHDCTFSGNPGYNLGTCAQDAIILGGTDTTSGGLITSAFQGYGTVIGANTFSRIRRGIYGHRWANSVVIRDNTFDMTCGGTATSAAIELEASGTNAFCTGNLISGNLIEMKGYVYGMRFSGPVSHTIMNGNSFWDWTGGTTLAGIRYEAGATGNHVYGYHSDSTPIVSDANAAGLNMVWSNTQLGNITWGGIQTFNGGLNVGNQTFNLADDGSIVSQTVARFGTGSGIGYWTVVNAGSPVSRRQINGFNSAGSNTINLDPQNGPKLTGVSMRVNVSTTGSRLDATIGAGGIAYDSTLSQPIYSDGTKWRDSSGVATPIATKTASYTAVDGDGIIVANGATVTITLPDPTTVVAGRTRFVVKNINSASATVASAGTSKTLDGAASQSLAQWAKATYVSDGTQWLTV